MRTLCWSGLTEDRRIEPFGEAVHLIPLVWLVAFHVVCAEHCRHLPQLTIVVGARHDPDPGETRRDLREQVPPVPREWPLRTGRTYAFCPERERTFPQ